MYAESAEKLFSADSGKIPVTWKAKNSGKTEKATHLGKGTGKWPPVAVPTLSIWPQSHYVRRRCYEKRFQYCN